MIEIDISNMIPWDVLLDERGGFVEALLDDLAESAYLKWVNVARRELKTSKRTYIQGIQDPEVRPGERILALVGWLPVAIEKGLPPYDLRDTLLWNPNAKNRRPLFSTPGRSGGSVQIGWYAHVPFRHGTPESTGQAGQPMGRPYEENMPQGWMEKSEAAAFGEDIYRIAKQMRHKPLKRKLKPGEQAPMTRLPTSMAGPKLSERHKFPIYAGMKRIRKPMKNEQTGRTSMHTMYFTWRTISTEKTEGWIHPGIEPHGFMEKVKSHVEQIAPRLIGNAINAVTGK